MVCALLASSAFATEAEHLARVEALFNQGQLTEAWALISPNLNQSNRRPADSKADQTGSDEASRWQTVALGGRVALGLGRLDLARGYLSMAEEKLPPESSLSINERQSMAALFNDLGRLLFAERDPIIAAGYFKLAAETAERLAHADSANVARYRLNQARALLDRAEPQTSLAVAQPIASELIAKKLAPELPLIVNGLAELLSRSGDAEGVRTALQLWAAVIASSTDSLQRSYALGLRAEHLEREQMVETALADARSAATLALSLSNDDAALRWETLVARLLRAKGDLNGALKAYRRSTELLDSLRLDLLASRPNAYAEVLVPVYRGFADTLLAAADETGDPEVLLQEARLAIEEIKVAEVEDYLGNRCVEGKISLDDSDLADPKAITIYPVVLADRLEILVSGAGIYSRHTVAVTKQELSELAINLRGRLQTALLSDDYLASAQKLYDLLIGPIEKNLAGRDIETIVFVPDGPLRLIPLSVLHDGQQYLLERYAIATSAGLSLSAIGRSTADIKKSPAFIGGISESVENFPALPGVATELSVLGKDLEQSSFLDDQFTQQRLADGLSDSKYRLAHIATHGRFGGSYEQSYLLAYDGRLTMSELGTSLATRKARQNPLDLLVLSACETAAGDDRSLLGLAGVALNAGANSVIASMWALDDNAAAQLIPDFYAALGSRENSKAQSLRIAQLRLLRDERFSHPSSWAPFTLIGNWL